MNEIANMFLLTRDKLMPDIYLRQHAFTYIACKPLTKNKERIQKFKETEDSKYIYQKNLDKTCFQNDMNHGDFKDSPGKTDSDNVLCDKAFSIAKN